MARLALSVIFGVVLGAIADINWGLAVSLLIGWISGTSLLLFLSWFIILQSSPDETKARAGTEDSGRTAVFILVCFASAFSLFASMFVLKQVKTIAPDEAIALIACCLTTVTLSWFLTHTAFTFRYARLYYRDENDEGGLNFPGDEPPDDFDFAYFSFTLGMAFQVSDVSVSDRLIRRTVLVHSLLSFAYNTTLVALALNVFFGVLGG